MQNDIHLQHLKDRRAKFFEGIARLVIRFRYVISVGMILLAILLAMQLKHFTVDTTSEGLLHEDDPKRIAFDQFRDQFGSSEAIIAAIGPVDVFSQDLLKRLKEFHEALDVSVPHIDDITSLINARNTRGEAGELIVEDFLEHWPISEKDMEILKKRARQNYVYRNMLIDKNARYTAVILKTNQYTSEFLSTHEGDLDGFEDNTVSIPKTFDVSGLNSSKRFFSDRENSETAAAVRAIAGKFNTPDFPVHLSGTPVVGDVIKAWMVKDMRRFMILSIVMIAAFLFFLFRKITGVLLSLFTVIFSLVCTFGIMAICSVPIKIPTVMLPSFLLAVGVCDSVHILALYYKRLKQGDSTDEAIIFTLGHSGLAVVLTSITTAGGFLSFLTSEVAPIEDLGVFSAIGVMMALLYSLLWLPSMLSILRTKAKDSPSEYHPQFLDKMLSGFGNIGTGKPKTICVIVAIMIILSLFGASRLEFSHRSLSWLPEDSTERIDTELIDKVLRGTLTFELVMDTKKKNGFFEPSLLRRLDQLSARYNKYKDEKVFVGKTLAVTDILKEIHRALNENQEEFYDIPNNRELVAQEFLLFENSGSDDLEDFVDSQFSKARFSIKIPWSDSTAFGHLIDDIETQLTEHFPGVDYYITGKPMLMLRTLNGIIMSMGKSYLLALTVITLLMILFIGDLRLGLVSMLPNLSPIVICLGIMGWMNIRLDAFNMTMGAIAIGLAVDDTIHFMNNFKRYYEINGNTYDAVQKTLATSGRAILFTTLVLSTGFLIYSFSFMKNLYYFGLFTSLALIIALLADLLISPALVTILYRKSG